MCICHFEWQRYNGFWIKLCPVGAHRVFDIFKPYPIKQAEKLRGGLGIVMDDLVAGVCAYLCIRLILFVVE